VNRTTAAAVLLAALATLTACSSEDDSKPDAKPAASSSAPDKAAESAAAAVGLPPEPTGQDRADLLAALAAVDPALTADEDDAIDNARNQCMAINGGAGRLEWTAQQRFSGNGHEVTEAEAKEINATIGEFCKTA
jgi:hypothetical protein